MAVEGDEKRPTTGWLIRALTWSRASRRAA